MAEIGVIGGGSAGLTVALLAARKGHYVSIFERKDRVGKKLLSTGNGRGNVSNVDLDLAHFHSENEGFPSSILKAFGPEELKAFFLSLGLDLVEEQRGKLYPMTLQAATVLNMLRRELEAYDVEIHEESMVHSIKRHKNKIELITHEGAHYDFDKVVLATGGKSMPKTGSDGSGYGLLTSHGHRLTKVFPAIDALILDWPYLRHVAGTKVQGEIQLKEDGQTIQREYGEILFTREGISGPPVLDLARKVNTASGKLTISMPLINYLDRQGTNYGEELIGRMYMQSDWPIRDFLEAIVGKTLVHPVVKTLKLNREEPIGYLDISTMEAIVDYLFEVEIPVLGTRGYNYAQVTCGGLDTRDFNRETLESNLLPNVYAVGEVLDVDGDCGGYNLHWAWASAYCVANQL